MKTITTFLAVPALSFLFIANPLSAEDRDVIFSDDFENRTELGKDFAASKEWPDSWKVTDGILVAKQDNPDHGAVLRKELAFQNLDIEFDFRFSGGARFNFVVNDQKEKSVHAGHICRVSISPKKITVGDDKTGNMNLEIRAQRQDKDLAADKKQALDEFLATKETSAPVTLKPGEWHHLRVRIQGDTMEAWLAGKKVAALTSPGIAHPTKSSFGFTVTGTTIDFDNVTVYSASQL